MKPRMRAGRRDARGARRKRRTREHVIAELSANHVERHVLACGHAAEHTRHDYGIDMILFFYDAQTGEVKDGQAFLQLKASDSVRFVDHGRFAALDVDARDLRAWLRTPQPVILVLYDAPRDKAYWLYVQAHFESKKDFRHDRLKDRITVRLPRARSSTPPPSGDLSDSATTSFASSSAGSSTMTEPIPFASVERVLNRLGFECRAIRGSHRLFRSEDRDASLMLPVSGSNVSEIYLRAIARTLDERGIIAREEFLRQLAAPRNGHSSSRPKRNGASARDENGKTPMFRGASAPAAKR